MNCVFCEFQSSNLLSYKLHQAETHLTRTHYSCSVCNQEFEDKADVTCHILQMHLDQVKKNSEPSSRGFVPGSGDRVLLSRSNCVYPIVHIRTTMATNQTSNSFLHINLFEKLCKCMARSYI